MRALVIVSFVALLGCCGTFISVYDGSSSATGGGTGGAPAVNAASSGSDGGGSAGSSSGASDCTNAKDTSGFWESVTAGDYHTCAIKGDQTLWCWGNNLFAQLGDGTFEARYSPTQVKNLGAGVLAVAAGGGHTCAIKTDHTLWCWGDNGAGQLGNGSNTQEKSPAQVVALGDSVDSVALGAQHTCGATTQSLWCWGSYGGSSMGATAPVEIPGYGAVTAGAFHTCAVEGGNDRTWWCWGANDKGQLGDGTTVDRRSPVKVTGVGGYVFNLSAGFDQSCALSTAGLWCWGNGVLAPARVDGLPPVVNEVHEGQKYVCSSTTGHGLWCWGNNDHGQLGDGSTISRTTPAKVCTIGDDILEFATGAEHACAIRSDHSLWCWGFNEEGELGDRTIADKSTPVQIH